MCKPTPNDLDVEILIDDPCCKLSAETLQARLACLIRRYVHQRSARVAGSVVRHFTGLYLHPSLRGQPEQQEALRLAARHWSRLAAQSRLAGVA
ncbi:MAG: ATP dependent RNA helicase [Thiocapsa sp.]|jgi:hypothetical protein|nr:ATP dependent RNA helicase [Thiocapsa sp.]MCG6898122.1 ATP dependent RNA helicase [Thiocapsa sp.]MCG6983833.1 ATP dependent RNA helicase [Thiocapsa sp.]